MSNLISGSQKHLTLNDRIYIEDSLNKGVSFKDITKYLCEDPTTVSKEVNFTVLPNGTMKTSSIMLRIIAFTDIVARKGMPAARSFCVESGVLPALPTIRPVRTYGINIAVICQRHLSIRHPHGCSIPISH